MHTFSAIKDDGIELLDDSAARDNANPDRRFSIRDSDKMVEDEGELYDDEREGGDRRNEQCCKRVADEDGTESTAVKKGRREPPEAEQTSSIAVSAQKEAA
ncbi:Histone deacetylase 1 [Toxocara canis]|uniref:Histone deacetylase 1 n=1 Tax=Toxocara canis TaxID=6265 RepID=A0A0B2VYK0_TOXCA|nr:Histone deacetylase 1 [Toxocara canis]